MPPFPITFSAPEDGKAAYDLIAVALIDVDGDGVYDPGSMCDMMEPLRSENGNHIMLLTVDRPIVHLYGFKYETSVWDYPQQQFWPGNPFGVSQAGDDEGKLSGKEADIFVTALPAAPPSSTASGCSSTTSSTASRTRTSRCPRSCSGDEFTMPVTMYTTDYYEVRPDEIENVELRVYFWPSGAPAATTRW